jgi:ABC-2 type transport system ATP-binding protein
MVLMDEMIIDSKGLVKRFGELTAVDHLDLKVRKGEIYSFLGPNGAGKTTTIRMLTTMDLPDEGTIVIGGHETGRDYIGARRLIGVIQQQHSLEKDISVRENIIYHGRMQNLSRKVIESRMKELCEIMGLEKRMDSLVKNLSGGWKKRVAIVCALIHEPDILFMDEPTTGLDTQSRNLLWKMIRSINRRGTTIFLTTHYIFEAEQLADRVGIIESGKMIAEGTVEELLSRLPPVALVATGEDGNENVTFHKDRMEAKKASESYDETYNISVRSTNLEDVFLDITGRKF